MTSTRRLRQNDHGVPHDLIEDILVKLPVKSLVRFKYVSQHWFRLITDPRFIDLHLSNQLKNGPGFVTASSGSLICYVGSRSYVFLGSMAVDRDSCTIPHSDIWLVSVSKDNDYEMLNSCDGILCFQGRFNIWVHNPATKEYRLLPSGQDHQHHGHCVVFTLDPNPNACWKTIGEVPYKIDVVFSRSLYFNGAIYWLTDEIYHLNQAEVIVMFDLHNEKFQAIPHPSSCSSKPRRLMQLGTLRECLCLAHKDVDSLLNIWIMEKQQQKITWEKLYCIEVFRNGLLLIGSRFAFAEHKGGTLLVCTGGTRWCHGQQRRWRLVVIYKIVRVFNPDVVPYRIGVLSRSVHVDGAIYWFTDEIYHLNKTEHIVMFDLHIEQFQEIPHPSSCSNKQRRSMQLGTLRESLCLAQLEVYPLVLNVWIMENQKQKITWEKLYCIQLPRNDLHVGLRFTFAEHKDGTLLVYTMDDVFLYKRNKGIGRVSHGYGRRRVPLPTAFTGSIVPLYGFSLRQFKDLPITFTEIPIFTVKP
ncbi:hypothetical protein GQ457_02G034870 [Hibiscus cannabinus]